MEQKATDELIGGQRHGFLASAAFAAIVFPFKRDTAIIVGDKTRVGDGDAVSIPGEISQYRLGSGEGSFGIDCLTSITLSGRIASTNNVTQAQSLLHNRHS